MEETAIKPPQTPAMDVVAPKPSTPEPVAVAPAPPAEETDPKETPAPVEIHKNKPKAHKPSAKKPHNGVGVAILATVVIVLGLAAMATYAYLKTQN